MSSQTYIEQTSNEFMLNEYRYFGGGMFISVVIPGNIYLNYDS